MTVAKQIANARIFLPGNPGAYARIMSGAIRSARSDRATNAFRAAIAADNATAHFANLNTDNPTAR